MLKNVLALQSKRLVTSTKATELPSTNCILKWGRAYPTILMIYPYSLSQVSNDQTGTLHKHIKPLNTAPNDECRVGGFIKWGWADTVCISHANNGTLIISALCYEDGCCMGVHSMGAPLMSQICPLFRLRLQTANDYLALGDLVIRQPAHKTR